MNIIISAKESKKVKNFKLALAKKYKWNITFQKPYKRRSKK